MKLKSLSECCRNIDFTPQYFIHFPLAHKPARSGKRFRAAQITSAEEVDEKLEANVLPQSLIFISGFKGVSSHANLSGVHFFRFFPIVSRNSLSSKGDH